LLFNVANIFSQTKDNAYLDTTSQKYNDLLSILDKSHIKIYSNDSLSWTSEGEGRRYRNYLKLALDFYNQKNYEASIDNFILARKSSKYYFGLVYYHLGVCLMDIHSFDLAKQSFNEAIKYFFNDGFIPQDYARGLIKDLFSYDNNGLIREPYFAYYNMACIESLQNNLDLAYEYLCQALFHGYPYISYIRTDDDLRNLFRDRTRLQAIEAVYNAGSNNNVVGSSFDLNRPIGYGYRQHIYFRNNSTLVSNILTSEGERSSSENYVIRNYIIFSKAFNTGFAYVKRFEGLDPHGLNYTKK
jgi:hypothetical protein